MKVKNIFVDYKHKGNKRIITLFGIPVYVKKYTNSHAYYRLCGIRILKKTKKRNMPDLNPRQNNLNLRQTDLNIAIIMEGGLGDQLINTNFIYLLRQKLGYTGVRIDIWENRKESVSRLVCSRNTYVDNIYLNETIPHTKYDLTVSILRFPILHHINKRRILQLSPVLFDFVLLWIKSNTELEKFIEHRPQLDGLFCKYFLLKGYKRWNQFDIEHKLGMTEEFVAPVPIALSEKQCLKNLHLPKKYITLHRGVDVTNKSTSVKQWPVEYYNSLVKMIKDKYPEIKIVQLGASADRCPKFDGIDIDLIGKTSLEQIKVILKHSALHIDGEGGMVHLRHALRGGKSIVLFGPTLPEVYGYSENINLKGQGCMGGCEWINSHWQDECAAGQRCPLCQYSLTPKVVFNSFVKAWDE